MIKQNQSYWIKSIDSGKCIEVCQDNSKKQGTIILNDYCNQQNQHFILKKTGDYYCFLCQSSGNALTIDGKANENGVLVKEASFENNYNQRWKLIQTSPNSQEYIISSAVSNKVLDVCGAKKANGTVIFMYEEHKNHNQIWQFIHADDGEYPWKIMGNKKQQRKFFKFMQK